MRKILSKLKISAVIAVCLAFFISFACLYKKNTHVKATNESVALSVWQIDSFEGGKGSRAEFLKNIGSDFSKKENCYVSVVSLSSEAARLNISNGNVPDIISYGAGMYGIESYVTDFTVWCSGSYCLLTLDTDSDFSDITAENTVINKGKDNFAAIASLFCGLQGGKLESPTSAYVKLINGEYKYLLGTQRDIFRLKTRNVSFTLKPVTSFNDLYQNISKTKSCKNSVYAQKYIDYLLSRKNDLGSIGMYCDGIKLYDGEMEKCENITFEHKIVYPINETMKNNLEDCITHSDINMLKELLK